jgi:6-phospho-3-hexuloisomerase
VTTAPWFGTRTRALGASAEISAVVGVVESGPWDTLAGLVVTHRRVFVSGRGRSGLIARAVGMRLMHLGLSVHAVGETTSPAIGDDDVLIVWSATAATALLLQAETARQTGATVVVITACPTGRLATAADLLVVVPVGEDGVGTAQHAGSLFEQSCLVLGDSLCATLQERLRLADAELDRRHANLS